MYYDDVSDDKNTKTARDEAKTGSDVIVTSSNNNICTLPVDIGNCKSYQVCPVFYVVLNSVTNTMQYQQFAVLYGDLWRRTANSSSKKTAAAVETSLKI